MSTACSAGLHRRSTPDSSSRATRPCAAIQTRSSIRHLAKQEESRPDGMPERADCANRTRNAIFLVYGLAGRLRGPQLTPLGSNSCTEASDLRDGLKSPGPTRRPPQPIEHDRDAGGPISLRMRKHRRGAGFDWPAGARDRLTSERGRRDRAPGGRG